MVDRRNFLIHILSTNNNNPFNDALSRTTQVSRYQKNIHSPHTLSLWLLHTIF